MGVAQPEQTPPGAPNYGGQGGYYNPAQYQPPVQQQTQVYSFRFHLINITIAINENKALCNNYNKQEIRNLVLENLS